MGGFVCVCTACAAWQLYFLPILGLFTRIPCTFCVLIPSRLPERDANMQIAEVLHHNWINFVNYHAKWCALFSCNLHVLYAQRERMRGIERERGRDLLNLCSKANTNWLKFVQRSRLSCAVEKFCLWNSINLNDRTKML